jgi:hypothetical protein
MPYSAQVPGQAPLPDSTAFTVLPGVPAIIERAQSWNGVLTQNVTIAVGDSLDLHKVIRSVVDKFGNYIAPASITYVTASSFLADTVSNFTPSYAVGSAIPASGWFAPGLKAPGGFTVSLFAGGVVSTQIAVTVQ